MTDPAALHEAIEEEVGRVLIGKEDLVERLTISLLTRGHILLEGVPGVAKTTVANLFARATGLDYNRIQMTPDILPADITGTYIYREETSEFQLRKGPVFSNLVVADEINRATPKTQSALLEAMQEEHVTVEGDTLDLPEPFMVIATQNPIEMEGSLHPDESVYVDGTLRNAGDLLDDARGNGTLVHETGDSKVYDIGATTQTLDETGQLRETEALVYEKEFEGDIYTITTKTGREISVSGNHPFLMNRSGNIQWVKARNLDGTDYLVSPETLESPAEPFSTHEQVLDTLASRYRCVRRQAVDELCDQLDHGEPLTAADLDSLRIASQLSKKDLAERVSASYDQVLNFFDGRSTPISDEIRGALDAADQTRADHFESHRIHTFEGELSAAEAGFFTGFVLADGTYSDSQISITQRNRPEKFDRWVALGERLGFDVRTSKIEGGRRAAIDSTVFVDYLKERYHLDEPCKLLSAPDAFRKAFLEIFLLTESNYDTEQARITFVQKDRGLTNLVTHLLLQYDIRPWVDDRDRIYHVRIQGDDIARYCELFEWPGTQPEAPSTETIHRNVPLPADHVETVVDVLGYQFDGDLSEREWYNAYRHCADGGVTSERLSSALLDDIRDRLRDRQATDVSSLVNDDVSAAAKQCGLSLTDIVAETAATKHAVWQAYEDGNPPDEVAEYVQNEYERRIDEAADVVDYIEQLLDNDVFYDPIAKIESEAYDGPVIGLSVPETHNYLAGLGACGINHNTFELPEAQRDRFQLKLTVDVPDREEEAALLERFDDDPELSPDLVEQVVEPTDLLAAREIVSDIYVDETVHQYIIDIVEATRESPDLEYGASPRASIAFLNTAKARAAIEGREYVIPDDVKRLAKPILVHRVVLSTDAELSDVTPEEVVETVLGTVEPPGRQVVEEGAQPAVGDGGRATDGDTDSGS
jgi:MoxR-like ATPase